MTPAYYYLDPDVLLVSNFQAPILDFLRKAGKAPEIDRQAFYEGFTYKTTPSDLTLFRGIVPVDFGSEFVFRISPGGSPELVSRKKEYPIEFSPRGSADPYGDYLREFEEVVRSYPDDEEFCVLFTGGLDSTIILRAGMEFGKKVRAVTAVQKILKKDDEFAIEYCRKHSVPHDVIELPSDDPFPLFRAAARATEDADTSLAGLSVTLSAICRESRKKGIRTLLTGSYIEPLLGSNPPTLRTLAAFHKNPQFFQLRGEFDSKLEIDQTVFSDPTILSTAERMVVNDGAFLRMLSIVLRTILHNFCNGGRIPLAPESFFSDGWLAGTDPSRAVFGDCRHSFGKEVRFFDLLTHTDLAYRGHYRNSLLNEKIGLANGVRILPLFAHANLRRIVFGSSVRERFSPDEYPVKFEDNKMFLKRALGKFVPEEISERGKTEFSVPSYLAWLMNPNDAGTVRSLLASLSERGVFRKDVLDFLLRMWEKGLPLGVKDAKSLNDAF